MKKKNIILREIKISDNKGKFPSNNGRVVYSGIAYHTTF